MKYKDGMLILGQNGIFCGHYAVNFSVWLLQLIWDAIAPIMTSP